MKINVTSIYVDDQQRALRFYTETLGFQKKREIPLGDACGNLIQIAAEKSQR